MSDWFEIFSLVTGLLYIILEIRQHNVMWIVGVLTAFASMVVFFRQGLFASFSLNAYYLIVSFWGLIQWARRPKDASGSDGEGGKVFVRPLDRWTIIISVLCLAAGTLALGYVARILGDPMSYFDVFVAVLSAIATVWLVRCHNEQWFLWVAADTLTTALCVKAAMQGSSGMWWMSALYVAYTVSAIYGYIYWKRHSA